MSKKNQMPKHNPEFFEPPIPSSEDIVETHHNVDSPELEKQYEYIEHPGRYTERRVRNNDNVIRIPEPEQVPFQPSQTLPNMAMSIDEILKRHASGLPIVGVNRVPMYDDENTEYFPDLSKLDLADRQEIIEEFADELKAISARILERKNVDSTKKVDLDKAANPDPGLPGQEGLQGKPTLGGAPAKNTNLP